MSTKFHIIWADGIGTRKLDPNDEASVLLSVVQHLASSLSEHGHQAYSSKVPWRASMAMVGGNTSWHHAATEGVWMIDEIIREYADGNTKFILLGYSGGCKVIHDWVNTRPTHQVAAVGYLSDPFRPRGRWQSGTLNPHGHGIAGEDEGPIGGKTYWTSFSEDVISSCPPDSPLRTLADLSDKIPGSFIEDFSSHIRLGNWQLATYIGMWRRDPLGYFRSLGPRLDLARRGVEKYLTGAHTTAYTREFVTVSNGVEDRRPLTQRLADTISYKVRKDLKENS